MDLMAFRVGRIEKEMRANGTSEELQAFVMDVSRRCLAEMGLAAHATCCLQLLCMDPAERCRYPEIKRQRLFQHLCVIPFPSALVVP